MTVSSAVAGTSAANGPSPTWNWSPPLPPAGVPYWVWPPRPLAVAKWLAAYFLRPTDRLLYLLFALCVGFWLQPVTAAQAALSADWVLPVFLRNVLALALVAGGLHLWFHTWRGQGTAFEFDPPDPGRRRGSRFFLGHQTWDNMFWTMIYGAPVATAWEVLARVMYANGVFVQIVYRSQ